MLLFSFAGDDCLLFVCSRRSLIVVCLFSHVCIDQSVLYDAKIYVLVVLVLLIVVYCV